MKNAFWTLVEYALYPLLMIGATPLFIGRLGIEQYGVWMLVNTITLSIHALNIGVGDSNIRLISRLRAVSDFISIKRVFNYNFSLSLLLCAAAAATGVILCQTGFISIFYREGNTDVAGRLLFFGCAAAGVKFVEIAIVSVFKAFERFDISSRLVILSKNSVMAVNVALVLAGYGLEAIFLSTIVTGTVNVIIQLIALQKFRNDILWWPRFSFRGEHRTHFAYNFWYWVQSVIALGGFLADKLLIALFTDVKTLGYYSVASLIGSQIHNLFLAFGSFMFPRVSFRLATNNGVGPLYYAARSFIALPGWVIIGGLLAFGNPLFSLWLGPETFSHAIVFIRLYLVFEAAMLLIIIPFYFINGTAMVKLNTLFEAVIRSSHLVAMFIGYRAGGVNGILYALIVATLLNIPFQYHFFHKKILGADPDIQSVLVMAPVICMFGFVMSGHIFVQAAMLVLFILALKYIYYDPARHHARSISALRGFFARLALK